MGLHTRGFKFCKLRNGSFVSVPPVLVQRCKSQFHTLPCGVDVILGLNGFIWVHKKFEGVVGDDTDPAVYYSSVNDVSIEMESSMIDALNVIIYSLLVMKKDRILPESRIVFQHWPSNICILMIPLLFTLMKLH